MKKEIRFSQVGDKRTTVINKSKKGFGIVREKIVALIQVPYYQGKEVETPVRYWFKPQISRTVHIHTYQTLKTPYYIFS